MFKYQFSFHLVHFTWEYLEIASFPSQNHWLIDVAFEYEIDIELPLAWNMALNYDKVCSNKNVTSEMSWVNKNAGKIFWQVLTAVLCTQKQSRHKMSGYLSKRNDKTDIPNRIMNSSIYFFYVPWMVCCMSTSTIEMVIKQRNDTPNWIIFFVVNVQCAQCTVQGTILCD